MCKSVADVKSISIFEETNLKIEIMKAELKYNLVAVDVYKTKRATNPSKKVYFTGIKTIEEIIEKVNAKFGNVYSFSVYDGDRDFVGNFLTK